MQQVVYPTRVLGRLGVKTLILTNAAGGIDPHMQAGDLMIITDHINLTGDNPLRGPNEISLGPRFPDMTAPYNHQMIDALSAIGTRSGIKLLRGIYGGLAGPTYETAAEVRYLQGIGASAVGMSTVPETIAARHMGLKVCGLSCITNLATGLSAGPISHEDVRLMASKVEKDFTRILIELLKFLKANPSLRS